MSRIFISYRREDAGGHAGRLYDRLSADFGRREIFMDIDTLNPGVDFVERIESAVGSADALIAVIGRDWLTATDAHGKRRLDDPSDFVRLEVSAALKRGIDVIPVLVRGANMPSVDDLPDDLRRLTRRQALQIDDLHWNSEVDRLIRTLKTRIHQARGSRLGRLRRWRGRALSGLIVLAAIAIATSTVMLRRGEVGRNTVVVPDVTRSPSVYAAQKALARVDLRLGNLVERRTSAVLFGTILGQTPSPGDEVKRGARVAVLVAVGPSTASVPTVSGLSVPNADIKLRATGFQLQVVPITRSEASDKAIVTQLPPAGARASRGSAVRVFLTQRKIDWRVIRRAYAASSENDPPTIVLRGNRKEAWAYFQLAAPPPPGLPITVTWFFPNGKFLGSVRKPRRSTITSYIRAQIPLPKGNWRAELKIGGDTVYEVLVRIR